MVMLAVEAHETNRLTLRRERERLERRKAGVMKNRASWEPHWRELGRRFLPRNGRFCAGDREHRWQNDILDNTATRAVRILRAGLMSGASSMARRWFRLATRDTDKNRNPRIARWLDDATRLVHLAFSEGNTYRALSHYYTELSVFGTACGLMLPDREKVVWHYPQTVGQYAIATDAKGNVGTVVREFEMTVAQMVEEFGLTACSSHVQQRWRSAEGLDEFQRIVHIVEPRAQRNPELLDQAHMAWRSVYYERDQSDDRVLAERGYRRFPFLVPRWDTIADDIYGSSPAMEALGDTRGLQHQQVRKGEVINHQTKPALQIPSTMKGREIDANPGGWTYYDATGPHGGIKPLFESQLKLDHLLLDIQDVRERINSAFFVDLFLAVIGEERSNVTAHEIALRHEEKLVQLSPTVQRLDTELLDPLVDFAFMSMLERGAIPPPPPELLGMELKVEKIGTLAQAQQTIGISTIDRVTGFCERVGEAVPEVWDRFDVDGAFEAYVDGLAADQRIVRDRDRAHSLRDARNRAQAVQAQATVAGEGARAIRDLSQARTDGRTALSDLTQLTQGVGVPA